MFGLIHFSLVLLLLSLHSEGASSPQSVDVQLESYFLDAESGRPHAAWETLRSIESVCRALPENHSLQSTCLLADAELLAKSSFFSNWTRMRSLKARILRFQLGEMEESARLHQTARLRSALGPLSGQDFRASLLSWRILERTHPETKGLNYGLGLTLFRQGNTVASEEAFHRAEEQNDSLALARAARAKYGGPEELDFGVSVVPGFSISRGLGLGLRFWDDRIADRPRSISGFVGISTRGNFGGVLRFNELQLFSPLAVEVFARGGTRAQDFFGLGMHSVDVPQSFRIDLLEAELGIRYSLLGLVMSTGGHFQQMAAYDLPQGLYIAPYVGWFIQGAWDGRDRLVQPRRGGRFSFRQELLATARGLGTRSTFTAEMHFPISLWQGVSLHSVVVNSPTRSAYNLLVDLGMLGIPGVREFRYRGEFAVAAWAQYRYSVLNWLRLGGFVSVGSTDNSLSSALGSIRAGIGLKSEFVVERSPRIVPALEMGIFNRQWIFQTGLRAEY